MFYNKQDVNNAFNSNIILTRDLKIFKLPAGVITDGARRSNYYKYRYDRNLQATSFELLGDFESEYITSFNEDEFKATAFKRAYMQY
jgi:hypothetical protein